MQLTPALTGPPITKTSLLQYFCAALWDVFLYFYTIKGGSRHAEKSRKVLLMIKAAKLGWAGPGAGQEQTMSRPGAEWEQTRSRSGATQEQGISKSRAGALAVHIPNFIQIILKT